MKNFILLLQFFTRLPININCEYQEESYGKSSYMLPLVGLVIGFLGFLLYKILKFFALPDYLVPLILLIYSIIITGALHLDGLADSCDGLFSYRTKERMLEIMRDSHIGANGVIGLIVVILTKFVLYSHVTVFPFALSFLVGRVAIIFSASLGEYAREKGMAIATIKYNNPKSFIKSLILTLLIFIFFREYIVYLLGTLFIVYFVHKKIVKTIGGITGDTLGFVCEVAEIIFLFQVLAGGNI